MPFNEMKSSDNGSGPYSTWFYNIFEIAYMSASVNHLSIEVWATLANNKSQRIIQSSLAGDSTSPPVSGTVPDTLIECNGTFTAAFDQAGTAGRLTTDGLNFTLADGTELKMSGDIGYWPEVNG